MSDKMLWESINVGMPNLDYERLEKWISDVAKAHGMILGPIGYLFCDDEHILEVNRHFLQHDYYTDIITFDYSRGRMISGDMVISLETVASNAKQIGATYDDELLRVVIHGILHLCGINDKGPGEREIMERNEDEALNMLSKIG